MYLGDIKPDYMAFCAHWVRWGHGLEATTQVAFEVDPRTLRFKNYEEDRKFNIAIDAALSRQSKALPGIFLKPFGKLISSPHGGT